MADKEVSMELHAVCVRVCVGGVGGWIWTAWGGEWAGRGVYACADLRMDVQEVKWSPGAS